MSGNGTNGAVRRRFSLPPPRRPLMSSQSLQAQMHAAREAFREANLAGYRAARPSRYRQAPPTLGGTADAHYSRGLEYHQIRELAREFVRDDPNVDTLLDRALDNVLGAGLKVDPQTSNAKMNESLRDWWSEASSSREIDWYGESDYDEIERLALKEAWVDGDDFLILDDREQKIRFEEGDRVVSPQDLNSNTVHGVTRDANGRLRGYLFARYQPGDRQRLLGPLSWRDLVEIPAEQVIHNHPMRGRKTQSRGISAFGPVFDTIALGSNAEFAQLVKLQASSCIAMFLELNYPEAFGLGGGEEEKSLLDQATDLEYGEMSPGMIAKLGIGEKANGFTPGVRTTDDAEFLEGRWRQVSNRIGMPLELGMLVTKNQSFSALRGVLEAAKIGWRRTQAHMCAIRSRVYTWRLRLAVEDGVFPARRDIFKHRILKPSWPYLDPETDAKADALRVEKHLAAPRHIWAERGMDYDTGVTEIVEDRARLFEAAEAKAEELRKRGVEVTGRDLLGLAPAGAA